MRATDTGAVRDEARPVRQTDEFRRARPHHAPQMRRITPAMAHALSVCPGTSAIVQRNAPWPRRSQARTHEFGASSAACLGHGHGKGQNPDLGRWLHPRHVAQQQQNIGSSIDVPYG